MKQYRIYTEARQLDRVRDETNAHFSNFTIYRVEGRYKSIPENSLVIEIIAEERAYPFVKALAESIKFFNNQDSVLITSHAITTESV